MHPGYPIKQEALRIIREERIVVASEVARRIGVHVRTVQRWFHHPVFKAALRVTPQVSCPHCEGTGRLIPQVYFARLPDGRIKIGTSTRPASRVREAVYILKLPKGTELLAVEPGGFWRESELHKEFSALRIRGEVFEPGQVLLDYISTL